MRVRNNDVTLLTGLVCSVSRGLWCWKLGKYTLSRTTV